TRVLRELNVDPDRIYFSGYSAGGGASTILAETWPHRVAAIYSMGRTYNLLGTHPEESMAALTHIPGFFAVGLDDTKERVDGYRELETYFKKEKLNGIFHFRKGKGHELIADLNKPAVEFLLKAKRVVYPKSFRGITCRFQNQEAIIPITTRAYWVEIKEWQQVAAFITARIEGNTFIIDTPGLVAGSVLVNDALVNMNEEVKIVVNGKEVFSGIVERSPSFLLDWFDLYRDRGELYWNRVAFRL
ncbi:MAG TPA: hypothetical protein PKA37_09200, partial [Planctomycetota bacterium]|nr:hypothetical protein [Planctomycetota bacterium]